ncbi:hypothetical protein FIE12Z_1726 [Fusarium flagelliforme]|uniref:Transcription factor domain-containing protein n=1 Tax=Fusarium flagelliforme TaxID=2675880 RepID=A0A395N313_9HYPO|nr:hypothetical protein FIE12Z_1726 [Fusarium flagelliforme]
MVSSPVVDVPRSNLNAHIHRRKTGARLRKRKGDSPGSTQQLENSTEPDITSLSYWPPSGFESITGLSSHPSFAPDPNIGSAFEVYGDFECPGSIDVGAFWGFESFLSLGEMPSLSSPLTTRCSQPQTAIPQLAAATNNTPPPGPSEPEMDRLESETPTPSLTQALRSSYSSNERSSDGNVSAINDCIDQDSDAWRAGDYCHVPRLTDDVYQEMTKHFARYNRDDEYWSTFTSSDFPPITHIYTFIQSERVRSSQPDISFLQAVLLNQLGMMFGPDDTRIEAVPITRALLETLCRKMACYTNFDAFSLPHDNEKSGQDNWADWIKKESLRRLFYSIWILDSPFHPKLWEASCQETWKKHQAFYKPMPFGTVLSEFYRTEKIDTSDPFSTLLLTVGVKYHAERLNRAPIYLGILQDHAKTLPPSRLSGAVESLSHLVSMFIYSPVQDLYAFSGWRVDTTQKAIVHAKLRTWIQSKSEARTALIHACNAWSMIRRDKTGAQHETMGFLVATLLIWAWIELGNRPEVDDVDLLLTFRLAGGSNGGIDLARALQVISSGSHH